MSGGVGGERQGDPASPISIMRKYFVFFLIFAAFFFFISQGFALKVSQKTFQRRLKEEKLQAKLASFEAGPFEVFTDQDLPDSMKLQIKKIVESTAKSVGEHFGYYPSGTAQLKLLQGAAYDSIDDPDLATSGFYQNKKIRMLFDYKQAKQSLTEFEVVFRHEYTHLIIASLDGGKTPRWLNEGLAVYEEKGPAGRKRGEGRAFYQAMKREKKLVPIREFVSTSLSKQYGKHGRDFYEQSYILAKYLVDRYGFPKLRGLLKKTKEGFSFSQALETGYGIDLEKLAKGAYES